MNERKRPIGYFILLAGAFLWCTSLFLPPILAAHGDSSLSAYSYGFFSSICHQYDSRSLHLFGFKLAVCARCSAVYWGFLAGVLFVPFIPPGRVVRAPYLLLIAALPMVADVALSTFGLSTGTLVSRLLTGSFFGLLSAIALAPAFEEAVSEFISHRPQSQGVRYESKT